MSFIKEYAVPAEQITLNSGIVEVAKFSWKFRQWAGKPVEDTYGGKAVLDSDGTPAFAELAIIPVLKQHGFDGAIWVDTYRRQFRGAMPPAICELPAHVRELYERIVKINGGSRGCWDVVAWNGNSITFVECKRKAKDRITLNEVNWLESGLKAGLGLGSFVICEWEIESS